MTVPTVDVTTKPVGGPSSSSSGPFQGAPPPADLGAAAVGACRARRQRSTTERSSVRRPRSWLPDARSNPVPRTRLMRALTVSVRRSRSTCSQRKPVISTRRRPSPSATMMRPRSRSPWVTSSTLRTSSRLGGVRRSWAAAALRPARRRCARHVAASRRQVQRSSKPLQGELGRSSPGCRVRPYAAAVLDVFGLQSVQDSIAQARPDVAAHADLVTVGGGLAYGSDDGFEPGQ